jgi:chromosomal replication initiator protein
MTKSDKILKAISSLNETDKHLLLAEIYKRYKKSNPFEFIQNIVCSHLKVSPVLLKSTSRKKKIVFARHLTMYLARMTTPFPLAMIGRNLGGRDHATVLFACNKIAALAKEKEEVGVLIRTLIKEIKPA